MYKTQKKIIMFIVTTMFAWQHIFNFTHAYTSLGPIFVLSLGHFILLVISLFHINIQINKLMLAHFTFSWDLSFFIFFQVRNICLVWRVQDRFTSDLGRSSLTQLTLASENYVEVGGAILLQIGQYRNDTFGPFFDKASMWYQSLVY